MKLTPIGSFLKRSKIPIDIKDDKDYKRVTIKIKHNGVSLRDTELGKKIGTKKQFILKGGQFIVSKIDARYGAFGIAPDSVNDAIITGNFWAYDVDFSRLNIEWFNQYTSSPAFYELCERASAGITHRKYLNEAFFLNYQIQLPSLEEQLIQIDEIKKQKLSFGKLTNELTNQLLIVKQMRQAFLSEAMQGKLVLAPSLSERAGAEAENGQQLLERIKDVKAQLIKDKKLKKEKELSPIKPEEIPFEIPGDWVWCRLGEVIEYTSNLDIQKHLPSNTIINYVDINAIDNQSYSIREVKRKRVSELSTRARRVLNKGYIAYSTVRPYLKNIAIIDNELENHIGSTGFNVFKTIKIEIKLMFYYLLSPYVNKKYQNMMVGFNSPSITNDQFENTLFPIPPLSIQNQIVTKLDELMKTCDDLENSIKQSQLQNEQLLQQVLKEALEVKEEITV